MPLAGGVSERQWGRHPQGSHTGRRAELPSESGRISNREPLWNLDRVDRSREPRRINTRADAGGDARPSLGGM